MVVRCYCQWYLLSLYLQDQVVSILLCLMKLAIQRLSVRHQARQHFRIGTNIIFSSLLKPGDLVKYCLPVLNSLQLICSFRAYRPTDYLP